MSVFDAVQREIDALSPESRDGYLAETALLIAERIDKAANRDTAALANALRSTLQELTAGVEKPREADPLDEIASRRAARLAGATVPVRSGDAGGVGR